MIFVLGVDPGLINTGWAIIDEIGKQKFAIVDYGVIVTKSKEDISLRLFKIFFELESKLSKYLIEWACLEKTLINKNAFSSMDLSMARGVILLYFGKCNIKYQEYLPTFIKKSITGNGNADKDIMRNMMKYYIDFENSIDIDLNKISHHEIDAIAIAIASCFAKI